MCYVSFSLHIYDVIVKPSTGLHTFIMALIASCMWKFALLWTCLKLRVKWRDFLILPAGQDLQFSCRICLLVASPLRHLI